MAAPTTSLGNVTVRKLNSVIASLWNKIKNTFAPKDDGQQTHDTTKFYRADGSWAVPTGDLDSVLLTSSDDLDNIHPDDFAVYRWRTTSIPMHAPYGGSGDATMHVLPIGDECCLQFVATCEISNNGIMLEMYRKRYKDGNNYAWTTWAYTDTRYSNATQSSAGLMSASDKTKLDGVATNANNYTHPTTSGNKHIPSGGSSGQILRWSADGTAAWGADNDTDKSDKTTVVKQISRGADFDPITSGYFAGMTTKSGISGDWWHILSMDWNGSDPNNWISQLALPTESRNGLYYRTRQNSSTNNWVKCLDTANYTSYAAKNTEAIKSISRSGTTFTATRCDGTTFTFTQQDNNTTYSAGSGLSLSGTTFSLNTGYTTSGKNYKVQLDSNGNPYVNVPWTDNNTTYNFSGTTFRSGNKDTEGHDCDSLTDNGLYYYNSNGPSTSLGASTNDGSVLVQSYSSSWVSQLVQDYRNGNIFVRGRNNGNWTTWKKVDAGTVNGYTVGKSVPSDAKFTDTTYSAGTGLSLSGTTFANTGVTAIAWNSTNKQLQYTKNSSNYNITIGYATEAGDVASQSKLNTVGYVRSILYRKSANFDIPLTELREGDLVIVFCTKSSGSITVTYNGSQSVVGATTVAAGRFRIYCYVNSSTGLIASES